MSDYTPDLTPVKRCSICDQEFPATSYYFYRDRKRPDGLRWYCKKCLSEQRGTKFREPSPPTPEDYKWCRHCREIKPLREFHKNGNKRDGRVATCRKCLAEKNGYRYRPSARPGYKFCARCKIELPANIDNFYCDNGAVDKLSSHCRPCTKAKSAQWQRENPERSRQRKRHWAISNPEKTKESGRLHYARNREKYALYWREHRERYRANGRKSYYKDIERSRAHARENSRRWHKNNPGAARGVVHRRAARKRGLPDTFSASDWQLALDYFKGCCAVCQRPMNGLFHAPHADHWIALSSPDCPGTIPENMLPLCGGTDGCNQSKSNKDPREWLQSKFGKRKAAIILARVEAYFEWVRSQ